MLSGNLHQKGKVRMEYLIGIDIGTQGVKAALFDTALSLVETAFEPSRLIQPEPGTVWQEPDDIYGAVMRTIRALIEKSGVPPKAVLAIGMDGQMAGIMGIDAKGEASTYYDSWLDTRSGGYVPLMQERAGAEMLAVSGGPVTSNHASKMLWWKEKQPEAYANTAKFVLPHSYAAGKMTGCNATQAVFDYTCLHFNSFSDNLRKCWNEDMLRLFGVAADKLPRVASPFEMQGRVTKECAAACGLIPGIPVAVGAGDTAAGTFGSGMFEAGMVQDCAGTASILCGVVDAYVPDTKHETMTMMRSPIDGLWLPLAYINGGGLCLRWFRDNFTGEPHADYATLEREAAATPAGAAGLLFCPHFSGRVLPADPTLKGAFTGLDFSHTRGHMYRAIMEGIALEYAYYLSVLRSNYPAQRLSSIGIIGGGANSALFNQIKADVLGLPVVTYETGETALIGSAVIGAVAAGVWTDYKTPILAVNRRRDSYLPDAQKRALYDNISNAYIAMLKTVSPLFG